MIIVIIILNGVMFVCWLWRIHAIALEFDIIDGREITENF